MRLGIAVCFAAVLIAVAGFAAFAGAEATHKSSTVKLQKAGAFDDDKVVKVGFGKTVKATAKLRLDDFFDALIINAYVSVKNTGKKPMFFHYYISFFDADGNLVGCAAQGAFGNDGLKPGEDSNLGSCLIPIPHDVAKAVKSYKIVYYESEKPIGKS